MAGSSQHAWLVAAVTLLTALAPSLGGEWCENFESGPGTFWTQRGQGGQWEHTTYTDETKLGNIIPKPATGEDGLLLLRPSLGGAAASSRLVSPELVFSDGASIQLDYWLWYNSSRPDTRLSFLLYRLVDGVEDKEAFLDITFYSSVHESHWSSIQAGLNLDKGKKIRVAIYGQVAGGADSNIGLDRVILRAVNDNNACGETRYAAPTEDPGPSGPDFDFFCPTEYGLYMDPEDCAYFYNCNSWMAIHMPCYTDLAFNPETSECDYRKFVPGCN